MNGKIVYKKNADFVDEPHYFLDGKEVTEKAFKKVFPDKEIVGIMTTPPANYPMESMGVGVHPRQREAAMEHAAKRGVPTEFTSDGKAVFRDRGHRRDYLKLQGAHDNNAYGRV